MRADLALALSLTAIAVTGCRPGSVPAAQQDVAAAAAPAPGAPVSPIDPQKYYAVLLDNGTVYYGKLEGYGTPYPTLRDVFYIQRTISRDAKALSNVLIKRGQELHSPDMMLLNPEAITFIEPVGPVSKVAQLIEQAHLKP